MKTKTKTVADQNAQSRAHLESIVEIAKGIRTLDEGAPSVEIQGDTYTDADDLACRLDEIPLSIEFCCKGWQPLKMDEKLEPDTYRVVLGTGGPHTEIYGDIDEHGEAETATIACSWWSELENLRDTTEEEDAILLQFAGRFIYAQ